mmetsp:Transcript_4371/g.13376  ORF Transcript_4371/g.13376 Transcript_4371/m.13376 type:complete len:260 (-) Transcript_4371:893-1672(-)
MPKQSRPKRQTLCFPRARGLRWLCEKHGEEEEDAYGSASANRQDGDVAPGSAGTWQRLLHGGCCRETPHSASPILVLDSLSELDKHGRDVVAIVALLIAPPLPGFTLQLLNCPLRPVGLDLLGNRLDNEFGIKELPDAVTGEDEEGLRGEVNLGLLYLGGRNNAVSLDGLVAKCPSHAKAWEVSALDKDAVVHPSIRVGLRPNLTTVCLDAGLLGRTVGLVILCLEQHLAAGLVANYAPGVAHISSPHGTPLPEGGHRC